MLFICAVWNEHLSGCFDVWSRRRIPGNFLHAVWRMSYVEKNETGSGCLLGCCAVFGCSHALRNPRSGARRERRVLWSELHLSTPHRVRVQGARFLVFGGRSAVQPEPVRAGGNAAVWSMLLSERDHRANLRRDARAELSGTWRILRGQWHLHRAIVCAHRKRRVLLPEWMRGHEPGPLPLAGCTVLCRSVVRAGAMPRWHSRLL